jgi:hypothetical protein
LTKKYIPRPSRRRVLAEFRYQCAYCHSLITITGEKLLIDHIIPEAAGGKTTEDNLCAACHSCNEYKGAQVKALDPLTGKQATLFHPRQDAWKSHFRWSEDGSHILGLTPVGRATIHALKMNNPGIVVARRRWALVGWHPPEEDL